jgi:outer membrane immunogenic protein
LALLIAAPLGTAGAADLPLKAPPPHVVAAPYNWTGCYIGGNVGGAAATANVQSGQYNSNFNLYPSAVIGGAQAGCNYEFSSKWVVGIEGDWDWTRLNSSSLIGPAVPGATYYANVNEVATLRARLGYAWDTMMLYATGGGAWAQLNGSNILLASGLPCPGCASQSATLTGWSVGGGIEYALTQNWILGAEYLYAYVGKNLNYAGTPVSYNEGINQTRFRVSFKF